MRPRGAPASALLIQFDLAPFGLVLPTTFSAARGGAVKCIYGRQTAVAGVLLRQATSGVSTGLAAPMNSLMLLLLSFAAQTLPAASTAMPKGSLRPPPV